MKLLLTSLGLCNDDIASALATLAGKPLSELSILFVPTAANTEGEDKSWLIGNLVDFQKRNFKNLQSNRCAKVLILKLKRFQLLDAWRKYLRNES